ncbi:uncharacterized protein LOC128205151 [Mya arenaria]|uniref:uncharacterized protein LOC128205151 n=1 Tax=Mya arenaria TaxID=6604 RepID=UPI0022E36C06|nr:uncharacterized protein LOC128205151 [Mya arenaria]
MASDVRDILRMSKIRQNCLPFRIRAHLHGLLTVFILTVHLVTINSDTLTVCDANTINKTAPCCLCLYNESSTECNKTCPSGFFIAKGTAHLCLEKNDTNVTLTPPPSNSSAINEVPQEQTHVYCIPDCHDSQFYVNESSVCKDCDKKCLTCAVESSNCTSCKFEFNKTCYTECPIDTKVCENKTEGTNVCKTYCVKQNDASKTAIIAAAVGGVAGVVVIIIIVVVAVCLCRRRQAMCFGQTEQTLRGKSGKKRTAMSGILENKNTNGSGTTTQATQKPSSYENTSQTLPRVEQIQQQHDAVTRYTKDPTFVIDDPAITQESPPDVPDDLYANKEAIVRTRWEEEDQKTLAVLGTAPPPPQVKAPANKLQKGKKKPVPDGPVDDYIDMSGTEGKEEAEEGQEETTDVDFGTVEEPYENYQVGKSTEKLYENWKQDSGTKAKKSGASKGCKSVIGTKGGKKLPIGTKGSKPQKSSKGTNLEVEKKGDKPKVVPKPKVVDSESGSKKGNMEVENKGDKPEVVPKPKAVNSEIGSKGGNMEVETKGDKSGSTESDEEALDDYENTKEMKKVTKDYVNATAFKKTKPKKA